MHTTILTLTLALAQFPGWNENRVDAATAEAQAAIDQVAREYRRHVYLNFRASRQEFDRRWNAGEELRRRFGTLDKPAAHQEAVAAWFAEATATPYAGVLPVFPELPEPTLPTVLNHAETQSEPGTTPPTPESPPAVETLQAPSAPPVDDNPFLPPLGAAASPQANDDQPELPAKIRSLLDYSASVFGGNTQP